MEREEKADDNSRLAENRPLKPLSPHASSGRSRLSEVILQCSPNTKKHRGAHTQPDGRMPYTQGVLGRRWNHSLPLEKGPRLSFRIHADGGSKVADPHSRVFCMLVAMLIISVMTPGAVVAEYQDNQEVVSAVQLLRSSDPRFQEGILLREAILERGELDSRQEYIKSELNDVADPASRNKLQTMRENAKSHGWKIEAELNRLALVQLIPDFEMLLARLIALTDAMHDPARSQDKFD